MIPTGLIALALVAFLSGNTFAADAQQGSGKPGSSWTGVYVGGHLGYGWGRTEWDNISATSGSLDFNPGDPVTSGSLDGVFGGGHLGFNYQLGSIVFGIEPSYSAGDFRNRSRSRVTSGDDEYDTRINHFVSVAARTGYAIDRWLIYLIVGYSSGSVKTRFSDSAGGEQGSGSSTERHHGFVMGPGIEFRVTPKIVVGTEYNYLDLNAKNHSMGIDGTIPGVIVNKVDPKGMHQIKLKLSYLFNW
jgi:outer membrane immunogenic protein